VKRLIKAILYRLGLGRIAEKLYFNLRTATPSVLLNEVRIRLTRREGLPVPPGKLIYDVIACRWADVYLRSGRLVTDQLLSTLKAVDFVPERGHRVLDFGCGCGRITRYLIEQTEAEIHGTDYNPDLVSWCSQNLVRASFSRNRLEPPLRAPDAAFDLVVARSVFTHLTEDVQQSWLKEMARVIRSGGLFYFTMHGPLLAARLSPTQRERFDAGELVVTYRDFQGANLCSSYAGPDYVRRHLIREFELIRYEPGVPQPHLQQDAYVLRRIDAGAGQER
jgi:SAM-dependent methyltransferase